MASETRDDLFRTISNVGLLEAIKQGAMDGALGEKGGGGDDMNPDIMKRFKQNEDATEGVVVRTTALESLTDNHTSRIGNTERTLADHEGRITVTEQRGTKYESDLTKLGTDTKGTQTRVETLEAALPTKADLVSGKIPMDQLPDMPVGRKVSVQDEAARLALPIHGDITIAYQIDTADAWVLDANEDPSVEGNWDKLGNAKGTGVDSFNGRTGNVTPANGDYNADQITQTATKTFVSPSERASWNSRVTEPELSSRIVNLKGELETTYVKRNLRGAKDGVASLGPDGLVPIEQLPPQGLSPAQDKRLTAVETDLKYVDQRTIETSLKQSYTDNSIIQMDTNHKALIKAVDDSSIKLTEKGAASGVATLGTDKKVLAAQLPTDLVRTGDKGKAGGIAALDSDSRIAAANMPLYVGKSKRVWKDVRTTRTFNQYWINPSGNETVVYVRSLRSTDSSRFVQIYTRNPQNHAETFDFRSDALGGTTERWIELTATIPVGWQYALSTNGGTQLSTTEYWYELG